MGMTYQRGAVWWVKYYRNGRPIRESSGSTKESDAIQLLKIREGDIAHGLPVNPKLNRIRFDEAADDLKTEYAVNGRRSADELERRIRLHLLPHFGGRRLATITTADVNTFILKRRTDVMVVRRRRRPDGTEGLERRDQPRADHAEAHPQPGATERKAHPRAAHPDAEGAECADGLLRARPDRPDRRPPAAGDSSGRAARVHHRMADPERGATATVAACRLRGPRRPPGPAHDEERRGPDLPVHRRPRAAPGGSEGRARPAEGRGRDLPVGFQPDRTRK